ncbi:hypothetical protein GCM10010182_54070 [Actinomadura cremea]|nr:hypothetical protein GCM10010182_54070 [Actinomadura cremea]
MARARAGRARRAVRRRARAVRLDDERAAAVEEYGAAALAAGSGAGGQDGPLAELRALVDERPLRERARALLMRALHAAGRRGEALAVFEEGRRLLADELGAAPSPELAAAHLAVLRGETAAAAAPADVPRAVPPPAQLTSFVGREDAVRHVGRMLTDGRLVTLLGPGGAGKTRLAVEAAAREDGASGCSGARRSPGPSPPTCSRCSRWSPSR